MNSNMRRKTLTVEQPTPARLNAPDTSVNFVALSVQSAGQFTLAFYRDAAGQQLLKSYTNPETGAEDILAPLLADGLYYTLIGQSDPEAPYQVTVQYMENQVPAGAIDHPERL